MTLDQARTLIRTQVALGSGYNRHAVRLILGEVQRVHGQGAVDALIRELGLEHAFGLRPGMDYASVGR